jgi:predicted GIY-YIG superfamily endonuclease
MDRDGTGRLMFDLRDKHNVSYTSLELQKAIELGYTITKVHEVIFWSEETNGIFKHYVFDFLKLKQEAAGWPQWTGMSEELKDKYLHTYFEKQGIQLDKEKISIRKNKGMYSTAKFYLNSLWGKYNERLDEERTRTHILCCDTPSDQLKLNKLQTSQKLHNATIINERCVVVEGRPSVESESNKICYRRNYAIGVFTTAQARLKLYAALEKLGDRVLYYDTDSIIFVVRKGEDPNELMPLGHFLGDWTNEFGENQYEYGDEWAVEFCSGGPKCYGYRLNTGQTMCKVKGFSTKKLNVAGHLNYDTMLRVMTGKGKEQMTLQTNAIRRPRKFTVQTIPVTRTFRNVFIKRKPLPASDSMIDTVPWNNSNSSQLPTKKRKRDTTEEEKQQVSLRRKKNKKDWTCYLLQSVQEPRRFYIGSSPDPSHRLGQHNGEIEGGAKETALHRPWKQLAILSGFTGRSQACKYEKSAQDCDPRLVESPQATERLHWFRKFLWPVRTMPYLKVRELCVKDEELVGMAREFTSTNEDVALSLQLCV